MFSCEEDSDAFFQHLNNAHRNLSFTMEKVNTSTNCLPFLDVEISITASEEFATKVYRKPTNTNVIMNYHAKTPDKWKVSLLNCFLNRALKLSSSNELLEDELNNIKRIFTDNGYPKNFVTEHMSSFMNKHQDAKVEVTQITACSDETDKTKPAYMVLPYIGKSSVKLHRRIKDEILQHGVALLPAYRTTKIGSYFSLKTKTPPLFKNDVVYSFLCPCDNGTQYIGETERQLFQRVKEHVTPPSSSSSTPSAVFGHILNCEKCQNYVQNGSIINCFSIIRQCNSNNILSQEALCIKRFRPSLNAQLGPYKGSRVGISIFN